MKKLLLSLLCVLPLTAMDSSLVKVQKQSVFAPHDLGEVDLYHGSRGFSVLKDGKFKPVQTYNVDAKLRKVTPEQLARFRAVGYLALKQMNDGEYAVDGKVRGLGGGPVLGAIAYGATKAFCYGVAIAGLTGGVVVTGGALGAAVGAATTAATVGASAGATIVSGTVGGALLSGEAAMATAAVVHTAGGLAAAGAAVESAACAAFWLGNLIPLI